MSLFDWRDEYSISHSQLDEQHRGLFQVAAQLHSALLRKQGRDIIGATLDRLFQYTRQHFRDEEVVMRGSGFPDYESHKAQHADLLRQVSKFKRAFEVGESTVPIETMVFLQRWLQNHIKARDKMIARHVAGSRAPDQAPSNVA